LAWSPADGFPVLHTARTVLREITTADAADLFAFRSDVEEQRHNDPALTEPGQAVELVERLAREYRESAVVRWGLTLRDQDGDGNRVVGLLGFNSWDADNARADIGYDLSRRLWGRGLAAEAVDATLRFGFDQMALNRIEVRTEAANVRSVRLLDRLGFVREGTLREQVRGDDGTFLDVAVYGLLRGERSHRSWPAVGS